MKTKVVLLITLGLFFNCLSFCDVIFENTHNVSNCVKITNLSDYPSISLVADVKDAGGYDFSYLVSDTVCLYQGYKFNQLRIYAVSNNYIISIADLSKINWATNPNSYPSKGLFYVADYYVDDIIPIIRQNQYCRIVGFKNDSVVLYKWKEEFIFSNGTADSVIVYGYNGNVSALQQEVRSQIYYVSGIPVKTIDPGITVFPNPSKNEVNLNIKNDYNGEIRVSLYTINGKLIGNYNLIKETGSVVYKIETSQLHKGNYFMKCQFDQLIETRKVIIE